ncbi:MAG: cobyrinate a,c-diamide synthase, partial [Lachnospiraceae bacterium]|nr:cobyrinate a,c-diamide synthase [Lachnospiraceae bacterium]
MNRAGSKRLLIAAPKSGSGKTTITCALLEHLQRKGLNPCSFKCGPDYIDPMFHNKVLGIDSRNLDSFFSSEDQIREAIANCSSEYVVIEGVMGLYDGLSPAGIHGSAYEIASITQTPILLVVDASGVGRSVLSLIKGMLLDDPNRLIRGVLLNNITKGFYEKLKPVLLQELYGIREDLHLCGYFPKTENIRVGSRHLGLMLPGEVTDVKEKIRESRELLESSCDMTQILSVMESAAAPEESAAKKKRNAASDFAVVETLSQTQKGPVLAVARDDAFCFYYRENLALFEQNGITIQYFSPITDPCIPTQADGLLLG